MAPRAVSEFQDTLGELAARSGEATTKLLAGISRLSPVEARAFITDAYPAMLDPFLSASATLTTQWYDEQPTVAKPPGARVFVPQPALLVPGEQLAISGRWALTTPNPAASLQGNATRQVMNASRDTVIVNATNEGVRWVRQAKLNACGFCKMLATRAAKDLKKYSYTSEGIRRDAETGDYITVVIGRRGRTRGKRKPGSKYHDSCRCIAVMLRDNSYDPPEYVQQWTDQYDAIVAKEGTGDLYKISQLMDEGRIRTDRVSIPVAPPVPVVTPAPVDPIVQPAQEMAPPVELDRPATDPLPELPVKVAPGTVDDDIVASNPNFNDGNMRNKDNCTHCVVTYDMRRRGYDVEATPAPNAGGRNIDDAILSRYVDSDGRQRSQVGISKRSQLDAIVASWGDGARGFVTMHLKKGSGHIISVENVGGVIRYLDPQDASVDASKLVNVSSRKARTPLGYVRVDDLTPTVKILDDADPLVISRAQAQAARDAEAKRVAEERAARAAALPAPPITVMREAAESAGYGLESGAMGDFMSGIQDARRLTAVEALQKRSELSFERSKAARAGYDFYRKWTKALAQ